MADRKLPALIVAVAALLVGSVLWDAVRGTVPKKHPVAAALSAATRVDTLGAVPSTSPPTTVSTAQPASQPALGPSGRVGISYMEQLARADARRRIRASAGYTYLDEVVAQSQDSGLHRWDDRMTRPVRVYLTPGTVANYQPAFLDAIRAAFSRWEQVGVPIRFDLSSDSERADVQLRWKTQFDIDRTGQTDLAWDPNGHVLSGIITIATFDPKGRALTEDDIRVVALHEVGHLIGLDHSSDSTDVMFARTQARDLSARDVRTALMLYQLAPGSLR